MQVNSMIVFRREFDNTGILFNPDNGEAFGLNSTAVLIWESLAAGRDRAGILADLRKAVKTLPDDAEQDVEALLSQLRARGFVA